MTPDLACSRALAMRRAHLRRKRVERVATWAYHGLALAGVAFLASIVAGLF